MSTADKPIDKDKPDSIAKEEKEDNSTKINKIFYFCVLSGFIIILIAGIYFQNNQNLIDKKIDSLLSSQNELNNRFAGKQDLLEMQTELNNSIEKMNQAIEQIDREDSNTNYDWAIAEAEYLLILALHRLTLEKDVKTALVAMQGVETRLQDLENPGLFPVREQLAKDINKLKSVNVVDISAMAIFLSDMITRVEQLPLNDLKANQSPDAKKDPAEQVTATEGKGIITKVLDEIWQTFKSLLVIRHKDEIKQALILPGQEFYLYQNLRLELENARLSVLQRDNDNLDASINLIVEWLNSYFDMNASSVINLVDTLQKMQQQNLSPELPDINSSLESLRAFIRSPDN